MLTAENYYSKEANYKYLSVSQYKDFCGTYGKMGCEKTALAKITGKYEEGKSTAMMIGSYVDAYFEGTLDAFRQNTPELFKKDDGLRSEYVKADGIIRRIEADPLFMNYMSGEKQVIMTAELFGTPWKIKMDSYHKGKAIVDLKVIESITKMKWVPDIGYLDFIRYWGYDTQGAVYQKVVEIVTGEKLPFYIAAATKESETDIEIIKVEQQYLDEALAAVEVNTPRIIRLKNMQEEPTQCGYCDYCRRTKVLRQPIRIADITQSL